MPSPFRSLPTLWEFIDAARIQGCKESRIEKTVVGLGTISAHYLVGPNPNGAIAILPEISPYERLTPVMLGQLVRALKIAGFESCVVEQPSSSDFEHVVVDPNDPPPVS